MRVQILQHVDFEGPGLIVDWCIERGHEFKIVHVYRGETLPTTEDCDFLILIGGTMSVHDESDHRWLVAEKARLREFLEREKRVLGICLGAQMMAEVLGGRVTRAPHSEIGWHTVDLPVPGLLRTSDSEAQVRSFHWHGDRFEIPPRALALAHSRATPVQAFQYGPRALALQFHPEVDEATMTSLIDACASEIDSSQSYEQAPAEMRRGLPARADLARYVFGILDRLAER